MKTPNKKAPDKPAGKTAGKTAGRARWILMIILAVIAVVSLLLFWQSRDRNDESVLRLYGNVDIREVELSFHQPGR